MSKTNTPADERIHMLELQIATLQTAIFRTLAETEQGRQDFMVGVTVALIDLHQVLIDADCQTRQQAADRLRTHIEQLSKPDTLPSGRDFLEALSRGIEGDALWWQSLSCTPPEGHA